MSAAISQGPVRGLPARRHLRRLLLRLLHGLVPLACWLPLTSVIGAPECPDAQPQPVPASFAGCDALQRQVEDVSRFRTPQGFRLDAYEAVLSAFFQKACHRDTGAGWRRDKRLRDTGPYVATLKDGRWTDAAERGTHGSVLVWYSPKMLRWLHENRPAGQPPRDPPTPLPDGAILVKEMTTPPAARCAGVPPEKLAPANGVAFMVSDRAGSFDGWFWGAWWNGFGADWPAQTAAGAPGQPGNSLQAMGQGLYCLNCHASARDHSTFADLANVSGEPGAPRDYLSQNFVFDMNLGAPPPSRHRSAAAAAPAQPASGPLPAYSPDFLAAFMLPGLTPPAAPAAMPSQTYDHVTVPGALAAAVAASQFLTADQCVGCHDAGSTGLQYDMAEPAPRALHNQSPYAGWRSSPMGLAGRDPFFYAQLASETGRFHPESKGLIEGVCLGCHAVQGHRQFQIDRRAASGRCDDFGRAQLDATPYPSELASNPLLPWARYAALGRDGVGCTGCHRMALTDAQIERVRREPQNACVEERQALLNPDNRGFARSFTGSFWVGAPDEMKGPFAEPKERPMQHALGIRPAQDPAIRSSELCGTCHTVHLPILGPGGRVLGRTYEQTTYPEWAFSAWRTGQDASGRPLPGGAGSKALSCQGCHMPSADARNAPYRSKIASIQEKSNFPDTAYTLPAAEIDLPVREGFARHTLVGLNLFLVKMAQQFPSALGIPLQDPMLLGQGVDPLDLTERLLADQAANQTATVAVRGLSRAGGRLQAAVEVRNLTGHKLPSGVGFRRAFLAFEVLDAQDRVIWASGRTNGAGAIVDEQGRPLAGEYWWTRDCSARLPGLPMQPHREVLRRQDEAQVYQELVVSPAPVADPRCGATPVPGGSLTTSFLSICGRVKDNRLLPEGFLPEAERAKIAAAFGAGPDLAREVAPDGVGDDPDYRQGGGDTLRVEIDLASLPAPPAAVRATLFSQSAPPSYLQDRFCTSQSADTQRLFYLAGHLNLAGSAGAGWKLPLAGSGRVSIP